MQRLSNMTTVLGRYPATRIASSTFCGQGRFDMSKIRGISNGVISRVNDKQNVRVAAHLIQQSCPSLNFVLQERQILHPNAYYPSQPAWRGFEELSKQRSLGQGELLKIVSWNIDFMRPGKTDRTFSAMSYLKERFGDPPSPLVIMLQEITYESLEAILAHQWVKDHFTISEIAAPGRYFTLMMVSRDVLTENWFRVPFPSKMGRYALVVDIPVSFSMCSTANPKKIIRLCTTHLESLPEPEGKELRPLQLAQISALLKESTPASEIVCGLVGGDMNTISKLDSSCHKAAHIDLRDIWEETNTLLIPKLKPFQKDLIYGRARGYTWGKQSPNRNGGKRIDKFFYTGSIDAVAVAEAEDHTGKVGRLGIGLKTNIRVWEEEVSHVVVHSDKWHKGGHWKETKAWVSDHYGIAIAIRVT